MKKRVFFAVLALFSFAAFFSCSNAAGGSDSESSKPSSASASKKPGYVTLTGTVSVSGAVPKILSDNYDSSSDNDGVSRSAQPGIDTSGASATMEYFARATSGNLVSEGAFGTGADAKKFGLELQAGIEWTIVVGVREKSTSKPIPARTVYLSSTWKVTPDPAAPTISHNFVPVPNTSGGTGSIALKINYSPSLYEVKPKFVDGPSGFEALNSVDWTYDPADGGRIYKRSSIPSGKYELCLDFKNTASQVLVYSTIQSVTVADGMITDSWVADSSSSAVSPISAAGEFKFDSSAGGNAQALMAAFLGTNLFVGKVSDDCAAPADTNSGNYLSPLKTVTGAVRKIADAGNSNADYVIRVSGEVEGTNSASPAVIQAISTSNAKSLTIIGTSGDGTDCIKSASSQAPAVNISTNVPITFKKIKIMGSKSGAGAGEAINAFGGSKVTIDEGSLITGGKIGVNVTGDSTKVTMKGGSFSGNDADVYLESGKVLTVDCNLSDVADKGIVVSLQSWTRGTQFLEAGASLGTLSDAIVGKFDFTKTGWDTPIDASNKKATIDADIYVAANGVDKDSENVENTIGNKAYPFKTIAKAAALLDASHNKICIDGSVGKQTISATDLPTSKCSSLILCGANGLDDDGLPKDKIDAGGTDDCGTALTIGTAVPITIQNLKITGGNKGNSSPNYNKGGGIYLQSGSSLELADGAMVTGNTCGLYGGGIYTESNTTLFMYGTSYVGDKTATTASGNDPAKCSNSASYGGGIHNSGKVYLGYKKDGSSFKEADWTGGVCRNYVENNGGGIYNSASGEIKMRAGTISYNKGSRYAGGIAVSASGNAVELLGGTLKENEANIGGGAVYVENSFSMQGSAYIPSGVKNDSGVLVSGTGKNDVYLVDGKTVTVAGTLSPTTTGAAGETAASVSVGALTPNEYKRGKKILSSSSTLSNDVKALFKLTKDDAGWEREDDTSSTTKYVYITSPIYVVASSSTYGSRPDTTWGWGKTKNAGGNGTKTSPYSSIEEALKDGDIASVKKIKIAGTVKGNQSIASIPSSLTALEITGYDSNAKLDGNNSGSTLSVSAGSATFPVTITNLNITGGKSNYGGGIYIGEKGGTVNLDSGAKVYSNKVTSGKYGAGVYVSGGATLNIKSGAEIYSNTAESGNISGGGVYVAAGSGSGANAIAAGALNMSGGYVYSNSAQYGGAVCNLGTLTMTGGRIGQNSSGTSKPNTATGTGGAIQQGGTFKISGSAIVYAGSEKSNDVYIVIGKYVTLPDSSFSGSATITPSAWNRGKQVLDGDYAGTHAGKFSVTDSDWSVVADSSVGKLNTGTTIYVSNSGNDSTGRGTSTKPYATIQTAAKETWKAQAYTISVSGTLKATSTDTLQSIPSDTKVKATSITLSGSNSATINANSKGSALTISKAVPVTIKNITITGGSATNGGGIYVSAASASLTLGQGAKVSANTVTGNGGGIYIAGTSGTGNTANLIMNSTATISGNSATGTSSYGGGVYLKYANLCMSGSALIGETGSSITSAATSGSKSNSAASGGGIYLATGGKLRLGYANASATSGTTLSADYGVRHNYASNMGGGIYANGDVDFASGAISYNGTAAGSGNHGGGIYTYSGTFTMSGGTIAKNKGYYGGGVYAGGTFNMTGGTIGDSGASSAANSSSNCSNYAVSMGGGVCISGGGEFSGGYIAYNYAQNGGGINVSGSNALTVKNTVQCNGASGRGTGIYDSGNLTLDGSVRFYLNNIDIIRGKTITLGSSYAQTNTSYAPAVTLNTVVGTGSWDLARLLTPGSGTTLPTAYNKIALSSTDSAKYKINSKGYLLPISSTPMQVSDAAVIETACAALASGDTLTMEVTAPITPTSLNVPAGAQLTLKRSTDLSAAVNNTSMSYMLNLNGQTVGSNDSGDLILDGGSTGGFKCYSPLVGGGGMMHHVTIRNNDSTKSGYSGTNSGNVGCGGAFFLGAGKSLSLYNCTISNCHAKYGGAIYAYGEVYLFNTDTISNCSATEYGGALYLNAAPANTNRNGTIYASITGCSVTGYSNHGARIYAEGYSGSTYKFTYSEINYNATSSDPVAIE